MKDFYKYKAYYCGLCKVLREKHGFLGQLTLTYDMTFLVILLHSLYESDMNFEEHRCVVHPAKKQKMLYNEITEYAADMNIVLTYFHFVDDWKDEKSKAGLVGVRAFRKTYLEIEKKYPKKCRIIRSCLKKLQTCEAQQEENIDITARYFGELMAELLTYRQDVWTKTLRRMGFYLGKFIYILDAYDDVEQDLESGSYNALISLYGEPDFDLLAGVARSLVKHGRLDGRHLRSVRYHGHAARGLDLRQILRGPRTAHLRLLHGGRDPLHLALLRPAGVDRSCRAADDARRGGIFHLRPAGAHRRHRVEPRHEEGRFDGQRRGGYGELRQCRRFGLGLRLHLRPLRLALGLHHDDRHGRARIPGAAVDVEHQERRI